MIRMDRNAAARIRMTALAGLLAGLLTLIATPSRAAQDAPKPPAPQRSVDFNTCAKPDYPKADLRAEHTGQATLLFLVGPDGAVQDSKVAKSSGYPDLDEAARTALARCRFTPADASNDAPRWLPVKYVWTLEGAGGAGASAMSRATQEQAFLWTARVLARYCYKSATPASDASAPVLDRYLESLDPEHMLFTRAEIAALESQRAQLARSDESQQLGAAFAIFEQMRTNKTAMLAWTGDALRGPLSALDGAPGPQALDARWPASDAERQALWRRDAAREVSRLRRAGVNDQTVVVTLARRNDHRLGLVRALTAQDAFETFMTAYVHAFDPHGAYFSPLERARLAAGASGQVGVGLVLKKRGDWITVHDMAGDGSAARTGQLHAGDRIVAVAQGAGQPATDVVGWGVDEVTPLLRGAPGSAVVLHVGAGSGAAPRSVALVRGAVSGGGDKPHATAKVEVLDRGGAGYRIGVVTIRDFYEDFTAKRAGIKDYASMTRDVTGLLTNLKTQRIDAVLLDMRGNGGGSLAEAIGFSGLFLPHAPVAQQRSFDGKVKLESAPDGAPAWDGPLAVLIDEGSAAATEIFVAAMQDHGRGLVLGDASIGRSSVQTVLSLDRFAQSPAVHFGELKMTVAQVYRVSGATFEQTGVIPDVKIPGVLNASGMAHQLAFPTAAIKPVAYSLRGELTAAVPVLVRRHETRTAADKAYQAMLQARAQPVGGDAAAVDIGRVQLGEALQVVGDELEVLRSRPDAGR